MVTILTDTGAASAKGDAYPCIVLCCHENKRAEALVWPSCPNNLCCGLTGRRQVVIEVVDIDADSEEELEDIETPDVRQRNRWRRVAQAATKQCLR